MKKTAPNLSIQDHLLMNSNIFKENLKLILNSISIIKSR